MAGLPALAAPWSCEPMTNLLRESGHHFLDYGLDQFGGTVFGAAEGGFEGVAVFYQVLDLGDDALLLHLAFGADVAFRERGLGHRR